LNFRNKIFRINFYLISSPNKKIRFENDLVVIFGHLRPGVANGSCQLAGQ